MNCLFVVDIKLRVRAFHAKFSESEQYIVVKNPDGRENIFLRNLNNEAEQYAGIL